MNPSVRTQGVHFNNECARGTWRWPPRMPRLQRPWGGPGATSSSERLLLPRGRLCGASRLPLAVPCGGDLGL